jgi:hypothetical protein
MNKVEFNNSIIRFKLNGALLTRGLTFIPPLLGILIFTYLVKFSGFDAVPQRIALYQGLSAYFSLVLLGFTYVKNRNKITGIKIIPVILVLVAFPTIFYIYHGIDIMLTALFVCIMFLSSMISYFMLIKNKIHDYLLYTIVASIILPFCLAVNTFVLILVVIGMFVVLIYLAMAIRQDLQSFDFSESGLNIIKSLLLQSPLIMMPFFDFKIAELIGLEKYTNYVLLYKYINGIIAVLFSFVQLNLMFSGELKKMKTIISSLLLIIIFSTISLFVDNLIIFAFMIGLYSFGVNLSSLIIRSKLMNGVRFASTYSGAFFVLCYFISLDLFKNQIHDNSNYFILFMTIFTILPSFLILAFNKVQ